MTPSPWRTIWRHPAQTIRRVADTEPRQWVIGLSVAAGIIWTLAALRYSGINCSRNFVDLLYLTALVAPLIGIAGLQLAALANHLTARMLGGAAEFRATLAATVWPVAPLAVVLPLLLANALMHRDHFFCAPDVAQQGLLPGSGATTVLMLVAAVWTLLLSPVLVAAVHRFSLLRGISTVLLAQIFLQTAVAVVVGVLVTAAVFLTA